MHVSEHRPLWWMGLLTPLIYLVSFVSCISLLIYGYWWMLGWIGLGLALNMIRTQIRLAYLRERFPNGAAKALETAIQGSWWMDPLVNLVHLAVVISSVCGREVVWAGIRYRLLRGHRAEVIQCREKD